MIFRLLTIFSPYLLGFLWADFPEVSLVWSLIGSVLIAFLSQTNWFRQSGDSQPITNRLLRPASMYHLMFVGYHVLGGGAYALDAAGYGLFGSSVTTQASDLSLIASCQRLMLLAHVSVTVGMKIAGFRHGRPKYKVSPIPPYGLLVISLLGFGVGTIVNFIPSLQQLTQRIFDISATAILLEIFLCIKRKQYRTLPPAIVLFGINLLQQALSGWKGLIFWTTITLGALLYPLMHKRVIFGGAAFILFWALYFYPFGQALRPLLWYEGVEQDKAVQISMDEALNMTIEERFNNVWTLMVGRANDLYQFGKYLEFVPEKHPYYGFDILNNSLTAVVPRILWSGKPDMERMSMQRVYEAGIVSERSTVSAKSNFYQDAYLSSGALGIIIACVPLGILIMLISRTCENLFGGYDIGTCLIYTSLFATSINMPLNFEFFIGAIWISSIFMFAIFIMGRIMGWIVYNREQEVSPHNPVLIPNTQRKVFSSSTSFHG